MDQQSSGTTSTPEPAAAQGLVVSGMATTGATAAAQSEGGNRATQALNEPDQYVKSEPTLYRGTDEVIRMPEPRKSVQFYGDAVSLNFEQAPLVEVIHAILGDILGQDYVVEHPINGEVTVRTRTPVPRDQLLGILESLLQANNAVMVRDKDGRIFVSSSGQLNTLQPSVAASSSGAVGYSTIVVPLQYISAKNMAEILRPVAQETSFVRIDNVRNLLMLAGSRAQLEGWQEIITTFDVDLLKGMSVGIFPLENSSLADVETALNSLLGKDGGGGGGGDGDGGGLAEDVAGVGSMVRIIPIERLNSIMIVTPRAHYLERIKVWIERLDQAPDANVEQRLYVYPVQNSSASHMADLISTIFPGGSGTGTPGKADVAPGLTPEKVSSSLDDDKTKTTKTKSSKSKLGEGANSTSTAVSVGDVRVVADEKNNALLIYANGREYKKIAAALARLDVPATQVIVEASIIEVTLTDELQYGLEWSFSNDLEGNHQGIGQLVNGLKIGPEVPGFSYSIVNGSGSIKAVLNALADENLLNVISSPSVMVLDNQTAEIQVGDQVPITTGTTVTDGGNTTTSIQYKDTGVHLSVTPSVNAGGMVTMDIDQSVTDVGPIAAGQEQNRTFLERKIVSQVAVRSAESVVLGGLIRENKSSGSSGIPLLHDLPYVGALFGTKKQESNRTELLVVITPRVMQNDADLRDVSRQMRAQMQGLELIDVSESSSFLTDKDSKGEQVVK